MQDEFLKLAPAACGGSARQGRRGRAAFGGSARKAAEAAQDLTEPVAAIEPPSRPAPDAASPSPSQPAAQEASPSPASAPQAVSAFEGVDASKHGSGRRVTDRASDR